jgi:prepilin-type N-terminal cleavage/methylation domain-containing protein
MNKRMHFAIKGFTLIELLVVIAIIGVIATVMVVYTEQSKRNGSDVAAKKNLSNATSQSEVYYINQVRTYEGLCNDATLGILRHVQRAADATGASASISDSANMSTSVAVCHDSVSGWAAGVPLRGGGAWCVDSTKAAIPVAINALDTDGDITCN